MHVARDRVRPPPLRTPVGLYVFHRLDAPLLTGYEPGDDWGRFGRATPEKALFDTVYVSLHRGRRWRHVPELDFPSTWDWDAGTPWIEAVSFPLSPSARAHADYLGGGRVALSRTARRPPARAALCGLVRPCAAL